MKLTEDDIRAKLAREYKPTEPEFPRRARHYFKVPLPEDLSLKQTECDAFIDVLITEMPGTVGEKKIEVENWGVVFDGTFIRPNWAAYELFEAQKKNVCCK